jgi:hypothetical protein
VALASAARRAVVVNSSAPKAVPDKPPFDGLGQDDPGAMLEIRFTGEFGHDLGRFPDDLTLAVSGQRARRCHVLHSHRPRRRGTGGRDRRVG